MVPGATIRGVAKKYRLEESTIRFQLRKRKANLALGKEGCNQYFILVETAIIECSVKSRINWGEILIVSKNNKTKPLTMKVLTIFLVIVYNFFRCVFDTETEAQLAKCIAVVCNLGFSPTVQEIIVSVMT